MLLAPGQGRRGSVPILGGLSGDVGGPSGPGPITRPIIAPIARPGTGEGASGSSLMNNAPGTTSSGSGSPIRRSPSPKGMLLGSSALAADDDEVVSPATTRRSTAPIGIGIGLGLGVGAVGQGWGPASPRTALGMGEQIPLRGGGGAPWGPPPGFGRGHIHQQQQVPIGNLWGTPPPPSNSEWHPPGTFFPPHSPAAYMVSHNSSTATATQHTSGN